MMGDQQALRRYFAGHPCVACEQSRPPEALIVLAKRHSTSMVLVTCGNCHHRSIFVVSLHPFRRHAPPTPVNQQDVVAMRQFLTSFDGDFLGLFGPEGGGLATE